MTSKKTVDLEFMVPLINDMVQGDPDKRPTIDEVVDRFDKLYHTIRWWTLRSRLVMKDDSGGVVRVVRHFFRTTVHVLTLRNALPRPPQFPLHMFSS